MKLCLLPDPGETGRVAFICMYHRPGRAGASLEGGDILVPYLRPIYLLLERFPIKYTDSRDFGLRSLAPGSLTLKRIYCYKSSVGSFIFHFSLVPL